MNTRQSTTKPILVGISGASASGKSELTRTIAKRFSDRTVSVLAEDRYYRDLSHLSQREREHVNYDHPEAFDHELLLSDLRALQKGVDVIAPVYDFHQHLRREGSSIPAASIVIVEGIMVFSKSALRSMFDLRIFIDTPIEECLRRRIVRDGQERGRTPESVIAQFNATVRPGYTQHIEPVRQHADLIIKGEGRDPETISSIVDRIRLLNS